MNIMERLQDIFRDVFDDDELVLTKETSAEDIEDWDSLAQIRLIVAIEKEFHIKIPIDEVQELQNVGEMAELVKNKLV
ncbi:MAG: acyl carrier protein [Selenomonadaceae bacterium]|nr:acyl carrier protein [Selenomonadaceae bacterium]